MCFIIKKETIYLACLVVGTYSVGLYFYFSFKWCADKFPSFPVSEAESHQGKEKGELRRSELIEMNLK